MKTGIYASTPFLPTDPAPWLDVLGKRYASQTDAEDHRGVQYRPRMDVRTSRAHTTNQYLAGWRRGPKLTKQQLIKLHNGIPKAPVAGPALHARKVIRRYIRMFHG